ncbi:gliding motility-associated C-terminal domain-containing protein, partial [Flavobacterium sp. NRK F10]|uniref:T9SS type B sorting domain-containing protein n=1 Tax=Flavobacterium sp. NRK F10 TaxID=2954931 RepID=UPI002090A029
GGNIVDPSTALTDGASYYAAHQGANCESSTRLQIDVTILDDGIASLNGETQAVCYSNSYTYTTDANMSDYQWNVTGGTIISGGGINDDFAEVNWDSYPDGTISVSYPNNAVCNGVSAESYNVDIASCSDLTITKTADKENVAAGETVVFTITVENNGTSTLNDLDISENLPSGYTYVSHTTSTGTYALATGNWNIPELASDSSATLMITVTVNSTGDYLNTATVVTSTPLDTDPGNNDASAEVNVICLTVYNEFSPNNDGENDYLIIDCIENYPNNKIEIFNRYGNVVYETASYNNNWNGMANVGGVVSKGEYLPNGTYFYVLKIDELNFSKTGWIYLAR